MYKIKLIKMFLACRYKKETVPVQNFMVWKVTEPVY